MTQKFFLLFFIVLLTSCGYRIGTGPLSTKYQTFSVPYIEGDLEGEFTAMLIKDISANGGWRYCRESGDLTICVKIIDLREVNIGFRYDQQDIDGQTDNLIPAETRLKIMAEVTVKEACGKVIIGPDFVVAHADFDHDFYSNQGGINVLSLGQLNDVDTALQVVNTPLFRTLAKKVAQLVVFNGFESLED